MMSIGPFSVHVIVVALAALIAWLVARSMQRAEPNTPRKTAASLLLDALFAGLIAARLGYVARWWPEYLATPRSILAIGDGGFDWWIGLPAAILFVLWKSRHVRALRRPALMGIAAGMLAWAAAQGTSSTLQRATPSLAALQLEGMDGSAVSFDKPIGKPVVLNLWASWCPPCRREMPILAQAQTDYPGVVFLMVNQGEQASTVQQFLAQQGLSFNHVLLDPLSEAMQTFGSRGLPTTLFFDARGKLVDSHMGEITAARLKEAVQGHLTP
ncbi:TlpA disulfide reductase family protein [Ralstonia sp. ASV6]|uniref:TlpA disulfide reductase family protein n=1 Tax=Ralstonia sp. ASV6 TaxID=2795124 RepID=UPI0018EBD89B|nr:TlpA disulfide reductase family protein [Ralstonia sp. ASV6]